METLVISSGMAARYFITDPDRVIAVGQQPVVVTSAVRLDLDMVGEVLMKLPPPPAGFLQKLFSKPLTEEERRAERDERLKKALETFRIGKHPDWLPRLDDDLVFFSCGIEKSALGFLKRMKLRASDNLLAVDTPEESFVQLSKALEELEGCVSIDLEADPEGATFKLYRCPESFSVVSGRKLTVVSADKSWRQLIREYPRLVGTDDDLHRAR